MTDEELGFGTVAPHFQEEAKAPQETVEVKAKPVARKEEPHAISNRQIGVPPVSFGEDLKPDWATSTFNKAQEQVGNPVAPATKPVTENKSFITDLKNVGLGTAGLATLFGIGTALGGYYLGKKGSNPDGGGSPLAPPPSQPGGPNPNEVPTNPKQQALNEIAQGELHTVSDAKMVAQSENNKAMKEGKPLPYPEVQTPQQVAKEIAPESPITASTSPEESATIANLTNASKTPSEAIAEPSKEVKGAVKPVKPAINELHKLPGVSPQLAKHLEKTGSELAGNEAFIKAYAKAKIPEGQVFLPGLGAMDNTMFNTLGPEGRRQAMEMLNNDLPFGTVGAEHNTKAKELIGDYGKKLSELTGQDLTTREQRIAQGLEHTKNYGTLGKAGKIGGVGGLFLAFDQLANAKSPAERREILRNAGEGFLPIGATPTEAGAPTLPPSVIEAQRQATLLGSPYHKFK
jgi:hypothetical protein